MHNYHAKIHCCQDRFTLSMSLYKMNILLFLVSYIFCFFFFFFLVFLFFVIVQSSGIETLVEELCSRLKDLQSKQGKE